VPFDPFQRSDDVLGGEVRILSHGKKHNADFWMEILQPTGHFDAVEERHGDIDRGYVRMQPRSGFEQGMPVRDCAPPRRIRLRVVSQQPRGSA
jgi:hypothetical protein